MENSDAIIEKDSMQGKYVFCVLPQCSLATRKVQSCAPRPGTRCHLPVVILVNLSRDLRIPTFWSRYIGQEEEVARRMEPPWARCACSQLYHELGILCSLRTSRLSQKPAYFELSDFKRVLTRSTIWVWPARVDIKMRCRHIRM